MILRLAFQNCKADRRFLDDGLSQTNRRTSHTRPAHIERLIPSARTQGHGDEYLRPGTFPMSMFMCSRRSLTRSVAPKVCPASIYRCLNPSMAVPCRFELPSHRDLTHRDLTIGFAECSNRGQYWIKLRHQTQGRRSLTGQWVAAVAPQASKILMFSLDLWGFVGS
jgi:hypothetical protein